MAGCRIFKDNICTTLSRDTEDKGSATMTLHLKICEHQSTFNFWLIRDSLHFQCKCVIVNNELTVSIIVWLYFFTNSPILFRHPEMSRSNLYQEDYYEILGISSTTSKDAVTKN